MSNDESSTKNDQCLDIPEDKEYYIALHQPRKDRKHPVLAGVRFRACLLPFHTRPPSHTQTHTEAFHVNREFCIALHRYRKRMYKQPGDIFELEQDVS